MKTINISSRSKAVESLLKQAQGDGLILKSSAGRRFVLTPIDNWIGYDIGGSTDFVEEAEATVRNKKLMKHLASRQSNGKRTSLKDVRKQLGLSKKSDVLATKKGRL